MSDLDQYLAAYRKDWINAGQPSPTVTIAMLQEIERLRAALRLITDMHPVGLDVAQNLARQALEPTP